MMFAKGGRVDAQNEMVEVAKENLGQSFALPIEIAVYVPSTKGADQSISENEFNDRIRETEQYLSELFGGYSKVDIDGGYVSQEKGLIKEDVAKVVAFSQDEDFLTNKLPRLVQRIVLWCGEWTQESIGFELEGDLFYIDKNFEYKKRKFASGGVTEQYYSIYDDEGDLYEFHLTANEVIDEANTIFYYDMLDADEEPMSTLYDAIDGFESMGYEVREEKSLQNILVKMKMVTSNLLKGEKQIN
ncbi:MAG: hypothetical protein EBQ89_09640 [Alphaproteobacteria bacterium]|nr:hypothetical protein [Alphaproteobacteria bacterium]